METKHPLQFVRGIELNPDINCRWFQVSIYTYAWAWVLLTFFRVPSLLACVLARQATLSRGMLRRCWKFSCKSAGKVHVGASVFSCFCMAKKRTPSLCYCFAPMSIDVHSFEAFQGCFDTCLELVCSNFHGLATLQAKKKQMHYFTKALTVDTGTLLHKTCHARRKKTLRRKITPK